MKTTFPRLPGEVLAALRAPAEPDGVNAIHTLITWHRASCEPSPAQLGPAEVTAVADDLVALVLWPGSGAARTLASNDGEGQLLVIVGQAFVTVRLKIVLTHDDRERDACGFLARVREVVWDEVDYARVTSRPTFVLDEPGTTAARWRANEEIVNEMRSRL